MKILLLGDTHCSTSALAVAFHAVEDHGLDAIFQVGDFGYWPRKYNGQVFLDAARNAPVPLYWLPGNHDDWDIYDTVVAAAISTDGRTDDDGFIYDGMMRISPRVHSWVWDDLRFGVLAGAYSVDRSMGRQGERWFSQEIPQPIDVDLLPARLDILLTHEAPTNLAKAGGWGPLPAAWKVDWELSAQSQNVIWSAIDQTTPSLHVHGHWHWRGSYNTPGLKALSIGLDRADGCPIHNSSVILDTERKICYDWSQYLYEPEGTGLWQHS